MMKLGNSDIMFVRIYNSTYLVPIDKVRFVQVDPNNGKITQEVPLAEPIEQLIRHNMNGFITFPEIWPPDKND